MGATHLKGWELFPVECLVRIAENPIKSRGLAVGECLHEPPRSSSVPAHVEMMGLIGAGNNPMVGMTVAVAVSIEEAAKNGKF